VKPVDAALSMSIDVDAVEEWFRESVGAEPPLTLEQFGEGRSNLTYRVDDGVGRSWVLRRPPISGVLATAHNMAREHRVLSSLKATTVPVPSVVAVCEDESLLGAQFFVMEYVEGLLIRTQEDALSLLDTRQRRTLGYEVIDALVAIHGVAIDEVGLGDLGPREDYVGRQLRRWRRQWEASRVHDLAIMQQLHDELVARMPQQRHVSLLHGDYRIDNLILGPDLRIRAILDWELSALGDPLADLGMTIAYWTEAGDDNREVYPSPSGAVGFPSRRECIERYAAQSGRDVTDINTYIAFAHWKIACIIEGVYARYLSGAMGAADVDMATLERQPALRALLAEQVLHDVP